MKIRVKYDDAGKVGGILMVNGIRNEVQGVDLEYKDVEVTGVYEDEFTLFFDTEKERDNFLRMIAVNQHIRVMVGENRRGFWLSLYDLAAEIREYVWE